MKFKLIAVAPCAFGFGTRKVDFEFGSLELKKTFWELETECLTAKDEKKLESAKVTLAEGVKFREFKTAIRNETFVARIEEGVAAKKKKPAKKKPKTVPDEPNQWRALSLEDAGVEAGVIELFQPMGIETVGALDDYAAEQQGLPVDGLTDEQKNALAELLGELTAE